VKKASITETKNNLSAMIDRVRNGSPILIVDRGRPVARLEPVYDAGTAEDGRLARLVRGGIVRSARGALAKSLLESRPARVRKGVSAVRVLLEERRDGR
jgi:prevent-host-death family protein